jgi:hypothetical protein
MRCTLSDDWPDRLFELSEPIADSTHRPRGIDHGSHLADGHREHRDGNDAEENVGHASGPTSRVAAWNCSRARSKAVVSVSRLRLTMSRPCLALPRHGRVLLSHADSELA